MSKLAVITGASSGIGEAFAEELAAKGYDLLLVARREEKLKALANKLSNQYSIKAEHFVADLSKEDQIVSLSDHLKNQDVAILINNAGFGVGDIFVDIEVERFKEMISVHSTATVYLSKAVLPKMIQAKEGSIINVASLAGLLPVPGSCVYPATKAFLVSFSEALKRSLPSDSVQIQALCPGYTYSEFHDQEPYKNFKRSSYPKIMWMSSQKVAQLSLDALSRNRVVFVPGWFNRFLIFLFHCPVISTILWAKASKKRRKNPS